MEELSTADFIIEAVIENIDAKLEDISDTGCIVRPGVILASNTSSISITKIASATRTARRYYRNAFHESGAGDESRGNSAWIGDSQTKRDLNDESNWRNRSAKRRSTVNDYPGFVSNRVLMPMINEAIYCVMEGVGTAEPWIRS